jgi:hypothetical protein
MDFEFDLNLNNIKNNQEKCPYVTEMKNKKLCELTRIRQQEIWTDKQSRIIIPIEEIQQFLTDIHENCIHPGTTKMLSTINNYYHVKNSKERTKSMINRCEICQRNKESNVKYGKVSGDYSHQIYLNLLQLT